MTEPKTTEETTSRQVPDITYFRRLLELALSESSEDGPELSGRQTDSSDCPSEGSEGESEHSKFHSEGAGRHLEPADSSSEHSEFDRPPSELNSEGSKCHLEASKCDSEGSECESEASKSHSERSDLIPARYNCPLNPSIPNTNKNSVRKYH